MTPRRLLALLLLAARAAAYMPYYYSDEEECTCTCLHPSCGLSFGAVERIPPTSLNTVPCVDLSDCESAPQRPEGPYYQGCWTVAEGFPQEDLPVSLCAEEQPRRLLRFGGYVDDRCFLVYNIRFWTNQVSLDVVGADEANDIFTCATADLAGVSPDQVVVVDINPNSPSLLTAELEIAVRGEAQARAVQERLSGAPPGPPPPFPGSPPPGPPTGGKTKEDATAAIRACALKKKAPSVWQEASVDPFVGGKEAKIVPERPIPADVQGCCWGSAGGNVGPIEPIEPIPLDPEANEGSPAPPPTPMEMTTTTTMTTAPYNSTA